MSVEDKTLARLLFRELNRRRHLDLSDVKCSVTRGVGYIGGIIRPSLGEFMDPKAELKAIQDGAKRVPGIRDVTIDVRFEMSAK
jgi:osmotically-inducible protein OsmY